MLSIVTVFFGTEVVLTFAKISYNVEVLFRTFVLHENTQKTDSILIHRTIAISAYIEKYTDLWFLKLL